MEYIKVNEIKFNSIKRYYKNRDLVSIEDLLNTIDDLLNENEYLKEELEDKK